MVSRMPRHRIHRARRVGFERRDLSASLPAPDVHVGVCYERLVSQNSSNRAACSCQQRGETASKLTFTTRHNKILTRPSKTRTDDKLGLVRAFVMHHVLARGTIQRPQLAL